MSLNFENEFRSIFQSKGVRGLPSGLEERTGIIHPEWTVRCTGIFTGSELNLTRLCLSLKIPISVVTDQGC